MRGIYLSVLLISFSAPSFSQLLFIPRNIQQSYSNNTRSTDGMPGKNYWQNRGDYTIRVSFDPKTLLVQGQETITYLNRSPDALNKLIIRLYPDYYKKNMERNFGIDEKDENEGVAIESIKINGEDYGEKSGKITHDR